MTQGFLPYGRQEISDADVQAVADALREPMITQGPRIEEFEDAIADYLGARHVDRVLERHRGAARRRVRRRDRTGRRGDRRADHLRRLGQLHPLPGRHRPLRRHRPGDLEPRHRRRGRGRRGRARRRSWRSPSPACPSTSRRCARWRGDVSSSRTPATRSAATATGTKVGGPGGADITCFSLHPVKSMTTGEGGLATTEDDELAARMRRFRTHGIEREHTSPPPTDGAWYMEMQELGFNYRITDFQCALGLSQLERLDGWVARRNEVAGALPRAAWRRRAAHAAAGGAARARCTATTCSSSACGPARRRACKVFEGLRAAGIGVQVHYLPVYRMPYYRDTLGVPQDECPQRRRLLRRRDLAADVSRAGRRRRRARGARAARAAGVTSARS